MKILPFDFRLFVNFRQMLKTANIAYEPYLFAC